MTTTDKNGTWKDEPGFKLLVDPSAEFENRRAMQLIEDQKLQILQELNTTDKELTRSIEDLLLFIETLGFKRNPYLDRLIKKRQKLREDLSAKEDT